MGTFLQTLFVGLRLGSVYALIALGYTMVYGIIRLINFAHGDFIMVGGYTLVFTVPILTAAGLPAWTAVILGFVICALVGVAVELIAYRPVRKKGTNMSALITAIAMSLLLENLAQAIPAIGPDPKIASQIFSSGGITVSGVMLDYKTIYTIIISALIMCALYLFTQKTKMGRAMRCVSEDKEASILMGSTSTRPSSPPSPSALASRRSPASCTSRSIPRCTPPWARSWASRPSSRPSSAASASCPAPCSADWSSDLSRVFPRAT